MSEYYFKRFEDRVPPPPLEHSRPVEIAWQVMALCSLIAGAIYIHWRWTASLNPDALWFAIPLALAETCAYLGLVLFTANLWKVSDYPRRPAPATINECLQEEEGADRPISVDVFIATYNEDEEIVRLSIRDAMAMTYPHPIDIKVHVLDDGSRPLMAEVAREEGANYITREGNAGFKAGNLRNAMERTSADFLVICDADTRPFPTMLENTLGYFRDPDVAIVQTPQWFYDLPEGERLRDVWGRKAGAVGRGLGGAIEAVFGEIRIGEDPFANDPALFYDVIQRRRNGTNAAFCCGAASVHRREAVMFVALRAYADAIEGASREKRTASDKLLRRRDARDPLARWQAAQEQELTPYKFHVSEDIYSTIVLHRDTDRNWKTVLHPQVESRMLSPQDLLSWTIQRFKYAGGSLDIFFHDNPVLKPGLSLGQRVMYLATFWSYFAALWNVVFLIAPVIYLFTAIPPIAAYTGDFFGHALPFLVLNELAFMLGTWGLSGFKGKVTYLSSFPISLGALWAVARGKKISFPVTPKLRQDGNFIRLVWPQVAVMIVTLAAIAWAAGALAMGVAGYSLGGLIVNGLWGLNNILAMSVMVRAAFWKPPEEREPALEGAVPA
ncbi:glycosyltransferase [Croceicoccus naphthovorans]|uniref:Cellulose synthase n=1 Tax=Croceicoccus naphthovorans TaxID=1348774 RepID=A0A0G3XGN0_9SPHN|nr:glycosyltransferase [Croceicoccus naphthovorans]AKM10680.1 cellulose synthase [Croceicoccus naphthovorans]MBB3988918.1 cellulose synthase (UDP-forming) [Croceicoccus naphthovorans]